MKKKLSILAASLLICSAFYAIAIERVGYVRSRSALQKKIDAKDATDLQDYYNEWRLAAHRENLSSAGIDQVEDKIEAAFPGQLVGLQAQYAADAKMPIVKKKAPTKTPTKKKTPSGVDADNLLWIDDLAKNLEDHKTGGIKPDLDDLEDALARATALYPFIKDRARAKSLDDSIAFLKAEIARLKKGPKLVPTKDFASMSRLDLEKEILTLSGFIDDPVATEKAQKLIDAQAVMTAYNKFPKPDGVVQGVIADIVKELSK